MTRFETLQLLYPIFFLLDILYSVHIYLNTSRIILIAPYSGSVPSLIKMAVLFFGYYFLQLFKKETCKNLPKCATQHNYPKSTDISLSRDTEDTSCPFLICRKRIKGLRLSCPGVRGNHFVLSHCRTNDTCPRSSPTTKHFVLQHPYLPPTLAPLCVRSFGSPRAQYAIRLTRFPMGDK